MKCFIKTILLFVALAVLYPATACASSHPIILKSGPVAQWIGAHPVSNSSITWDDANSQIGPLKTQRLFYTTLPDSYSDDGGDCSGLPAGVMCVISYQTPTTNISSYIASVPSNRQVMLLYVHEPEGTDSNGAPKFTSGAAFVSAFVAQSQLIRSAAAGRTNIKVGMAAEMFAYAKGGAGYDCSYIPPASATNYYLVDAYDPDGMLLQNDPKMARWMECTNGKGARGFAEWGVGPTSCITSGMTREAVMSKDISWMRTAFPHMFMLEYWWADNSAISPCRDWQFSTAEDAAWKAAG